MKVVARLHGNLHISWYVVPCKSVVFVSALAHEKTNNINIFLVDAYPFYAASALAANSFVRCAFSGKALLTTCMNFGLYDHIVTNSLQLLTDLICSCFPAVWDIYVQHTWLPVGFESNCFPNCYDAPVSVFVFPVRKTVTKTE